MSGGRGSTNLMVLTLRHRGQGTVLSLLTLLLPSCTALFSPRLTTLCSQAAICVYTNFITQRNPHSTSLCPSLPAGSEEVSATSASQGCSSLSSLSLCSGFQDDWAGVVLLIYQ